MKVSNRKFTVESLKSGKIAIQRDGKELLQQPVYFEKTTDGYVMVAVDSDGELSTYTDSGRFSKGDRTTDYDLLEAEQ